MPEQHVLKLTIEHYGETVEIGSVDLSEVDPTDPSAPETLAESLRLQLVAWYTQERTKLLDAEN
jgi:hypothetical protein